VTYSFIAVDQPRPFVTRIILNRPDRANALSRSMFAEIDRAFETARLDGTRSIVLTGAGRPDGRPWFSAGADLSEQDPAAARDGVDPAATIDRIDASLIPVIAAIDGLCTTGALELALACDMRIAASSARFADVHLAKVGNAIGGWGMATRLSRLIGVDRAKEFLLLGEEVSADEALRIGLVNRVSSSDDLLPIALDMASTIADRRPDGVRLSMAFFETHSDMAKHEALRWASTISDVMGIERRSAEFRNSTT
jgi:enoyl-CoA hydratase/carnithine racemase